MYKQMGSFAKLLKLARLEDELDAGTISVAGENYAGCSEGSGNRLAVNLGQSLKAVIRFSTANCTDADARSL